MSNELPLTGGCACGAVRFELSEPPVTASYCHCTRCQHRTGTAASANAGVARGSFRLLSGADRLGTWSPQGGFHKVFCTSCGAALYSQSPTDPEVIGVRLGASDRDPGVRPAYRQFVAFAAPWEPIPDDGLPRHAEGRPR